jgi:hypothetical protein
MRTTLDIDDDVLQIAKEIARLKNQGIGRALSARRGLVPETAPVIEVHNGVPVWMHGPGAVPVTSELVRNLADANANSPYRPV